MLPAALLNCVSAVLLLASQAGGQTVASTGVISGRVVDDATFRPLGNARVFLYPVPFPDGGRPSLVMTSQDGEFSFTAVKPGSYRLGTNKLGFFATPGVGMPFVTIPDSGEPVRLELTMSKGGTLAGRVLDQSGRPLKDVWVAGLRVVGGATLEQSIPSVTTARTNRLGEYEVQSLQPGQYVIVANPGHGPIGAAAAGTTDSLTYFPGTLDFTKAQRVTVGSAQTVAGLDVKMVRAPTFEVSGVVVDDGGRAVIGALVSVDADWPKFGGPKGSSRTGSDGRFRIDLITAGEYMLTVTSAGDEVRPVTRQTPFIRVSVVDADIDGLVIQLPLR
jgi:hypothetical protein